MAGRITPRMFRFGDRFLELRADVGSERAYEIISEGQNTGIALGQIRDQVVGAEAEGRGRQVNRGLVLDLLWSFSETYRWETEPWASMDDLTKPPRERKSYRLFLKEMDYSDLKRAYDVLVPLLVQHISPPMEPDSPSQSEADREPVADTVSAQN